MDLVMNGLATGRAVRVLTIVDSYTRECLAIEVDSCSSSRRVTRALEWVIQQQARLWSHHKGDVYNDGRFATLRDVIKHYDTFKQLGLAEQQKRDLIEYQESL